MMRTTCVSSDGAAEAPASSGTRLRFRASHLPLTRCACRSILPIAIPREAARSGPVPFPWRKCSPRACSVTSAWCRDRSRASTTCADTALSLSMRSVGASCRSTSFLVAGVIVRCRAVSSRRMGVVWTQPRTGCASSQRPLVQNLALVGRRNLELLAVFRDGSSRELEPLALQDVDDLRIAQRLARILLFDDLPDSLLDRHRGHRLAVRARNAAVEEILHLEHALRRVHVLVRDDTADRGLVHADVVGDVAQHQRPQILDAVI